MQTSRLRLHRSSSNLKLKFRHDLIVATVQISGTTIRLKHLPMYRVHHVLHVDPSVNHRLFQASRSKVGRGTTDYAKHHT